MSSLYVCRTELVTAFGIQGEIQDSEGGEAMTTSDSWRLICSYTWTIASQRLPLFLILIFRHEREPAATRRSLCDLLEGKVDEEVIS